MALGGCMAPWQRSEELSKTDTPEPSTPSPTPGYRYPEMEKYVKMFRDEIKHTDEEDGIHIEDLRWWNPRENRHRTGEINLKYRTRGQTSWIMYQEIRIIVEGYIHAVEQGMSYHNLTSEIFYEREKLGEFPVGMRHVEPHVEGDMSKEWTIQQVLQEVEVEE